ncbi:hypothetical protein [Tumebacillus flagellatus]|uniref:Uncharacterized protein n=1 Tax=Tumebacillus flagellatus TaxID=1157490 RepID=A0A074LJ58_9BACL|nr:hypothetical protein [Tumebacillus flagellatus]KEO81124.1 hypothetical protein EL26_22560 [Tumebacillus flagellatus]
MYQSKTLATPAASPEAAHRFFLNKLTVETDVADVIVDSQNGPLPYQLIDGFEYWEIEGGPVER